MADRRGRFLSSPGRGRMRLVGKEGERGGREHQVPAAGPRPDGAGADLAGAESAREAVRRDPKNAEAHHYLGLILMNLSEYDQAIDHLETAVKIDPHYTDAHNVLGVVYRETKQYDKSLKEFQAALSDRTYRTPEKIQLNLGNLYLDQGVLGEAQRSFQKAVEINPKYLLGYIGLGTTYQRMGKPDLASAQFRKVLELSPTGPEAERAKQLLSSPGARSGS